jgi:hypothetical protein
MRTILEVERYSRDKSEKHLTSAKQHRMEQSTRSQARATRSALETLLGLIHREKRGHDAEQLSSQELVPDR